VADDAILVRPAPQSRGNQVPTDPRRLKMKWHTPKIVEIACGGEINAYFPAEL
jgi:coenzyme PQQ precursor peptide PqqA